MYFCRIILKPVIMKKNIVFCLCVAVIALFSACNKDPEGIYNPSKKIQKVYTIEDGAQLLSELWHWDGDLLKSYDKYYGMEFYTTSFTYDNTNRVIAMDDNGSHAEFIYEGKKIKKIVITSLLNNSEAAYYEFEHKGNKMSQIKMNINIDWDDIWGDDWDWKAQSIIAPLRLLVPEITSSVKSVVKNCSKDAKGEEVVFDLHWKGDNVKTMDVSYAGYLGMVKETVELTYDNKINPLRGLIGMLGSDAVANLFVNKNNPLTIVTNVNGSVPFDNQTYTYEYEDDYPVKVTRVDVENPGTAYETTDTYTTIYEY